MKALTYNRFGPPEVLSVIEVPRPAPRPGEVLIRVHATTVTAAEMLMRRGEPLWGRLILGLTRPRPSLRTLGLEFSGVIVETGAEVTRFAPGDEVFGFTGFAVGACAEYKCLPADGSLERKPAGLTHREAAALVDGASTALYFLRDRADVRRGQHVLVNGASGSIGTYAVQLAKHLGAEVTAVCSGRNAELVTSLGADHVIDYTVEDFCARRGAYDVVFDTITASSYRRCRRSLKATGSYLPTTGLYNWPIAGWTALRPGPTVRPGFSVDKRAALPYLRDLVDDGALRVVLDSDYSLDEAVAAHHYVESGRKRGNVTMTLVPES